MQVEVCRTQDNAEIALVAEIGGAYHRLGQSKAWSYAKVSLKDLNVLGKERGLYTLYSLSVLH